MAIRLCSSCAFLVHREDGTSSCQVVNPGQCTQIEDPQDEDSICPKWENMSLKASVQKKRNSREEVVVYDIIR